MGDLAGAARLEGRRVVLRSVSDADVDRLVEILTAPDVARWWGRFDAAKVRQEFLDDAAAGTAFVVEVAGVVIGAIEYREENDPEFRHAGLDIALDPAWHGQRLGTDALRTLARHLFDDVGHHRLTIDPVVENTAAVRAYERIGFRPVGVMRRYQLLPDGRWHDGLLMDLLPEELR